MKRGILTVALALTGLFAAAVAQPAMAEGKTHYLAIHVDQNDPKVMNLALNNAQNVSKYYQSKGEKVEIEIVTYGPGLHMLRSDTSPVKERIAVMGLEMDNLQFSACGVTRGKMAKKEGMEISLVSEATPVPSGVVRLIELQEEGWAYVRP
jgi:intracellular sulfur oxidation DsrE/DsrF family protein